MDRKISIIVPVYNAEAYIGKNLESILNQTYTNYEVIVINDGSTDRTKEIVETYLEKFPKGKATLINIDNGGLANARNVGIKVAKGDFFCNLDADDYLDNDIFEKVNEIEEDYDICYYGWKDILEDGHKIKSVYDESFRFIDSSITGIEAAKMKLNKEIWICQGNAVYRTSMIKENKIFNIKGKNQGEDLYFITRALLHAKKVCCVKQNAFNCLIRKESMMHSKFNDSHLQVLDLIERLITDLENYRFLGDERENIENLLKIEYLRSTLGVSKKIIDSNNIKNINEIYRIIKSKLKTNKKSYSLNTNKLNRRLEIESTIFFNNIYIYILFVKLFRKIKKA